MPDVTPAGPLSVALDALRSLLANVPQFQTWTGTNATTALARIFVGEAGFAIASIVIAAGVVTVTTRDTHNFAAASTVTLAGASVGAESDVALNGAHTVAAVGSRTFTFATALADAAEFFPDGAFIIPCARPFAVISEGDDPVRSDVIGTGGAVVYGGTAEIMIEGDVSTGYQSDSINALYEARNAYGQLLQGLAVTQGTGDLMCLNKVESAVGPRFTNMAEQDDNSTRFERWQALIRVSWGVEG
jgi:hypothetical protein